MSRFKISFKSKKKLQQRIVFGILAFVLSAGLLVSSLNFIPGLNNAPANNTNTAAEEPKLPTAAELEEKAVASPGDVGVLKDLALAYSREGQPAKAVETYQKAVSQSPDREDLKTGLAGSYIAAGNYTQAQKTVEEVIGLNPNNKEAHYYYGHVLVEKKDYARAVEEFNQYIKLAGEKDPHAENVKSLIDVLQPLIKK
ncbi:MAG: tetratricopeptide repeat protein [Desulfocucumaceae bacterium]